MPVLTFRPGRRVYPAVAARPAWALGCLIVVSFGARLYAAASRPTAMYFPDEYLYRSLAESLATAGRPLVRGASVGFPALLEPLLAAPFWLAGDAELAYRLTQTLHSLALSLAAVPAYLLARRLALAPGLALTVAALAVASPNLRYAAFILADPVAYPLVLAAVCAGVSTIARPSGRAQVAFATFSALAAFARLQFAVLPLVLVAAALLVERGRIRVVVRQLRLSLTLFSLAAVGLAGLGLPRHLDFYAGLWDVDAAATIRWLAADTLLLAYAAGWILVPGAVAALAGGLVSPRSRAEGAFAAFTSVLATALLLEAALVAAADSERFQERYLFSLLPLLAIACCLSFRRGRGTLVAAGGLSLVLFVLAARVPVAGYVAFGSDDSATLTALRWLEDAVGVGTGSLLVAAAAGGLSIAALVCAARPGLGAPVALGLGLLVATGLSAAVAIVDGRNSRFARDAYLPADSGWVDELDLGSVALLQPPAASPSRALNQLFWNRSVDSVLLLGRDGAPDGFGAQAARMARDGSLWAGGARVRKPLLVQTRGSILVFSGGTLLGRAPGFELWRSTPALRLRFLAAGRYSDGWLAGSGRFTVWGESAGFEPETLNFALSLPDNEEVTHIRLLGRETDRRIRLLPGETRRLSLRLPKERPWTVRFQSDRLVSLGDGRVVSVRATRPCVSGGARRLAEEGCR